MISLNDCVSIVTQGGSLSRQQINAVAEAPLNDLLRAANEVRVNRIGNRGNLCAIINAKSGRCGENCRYCAQSVHYPTHPPVYPLLAAEEILRAAREHEANGVQRFSIVTSGGALSDADFLTILEVYATLKAETSLTLCASLGLLTAERAEALCHAGVSFYHHNLEASRNYFPNTCTTHTWEQRADTIRCAHAAGMSVCSGGIFGLGEQLSDRIDMAFELRELQVESIPLNIHTPIPGTPLQDVPLMPPDDYLRAAALYRLIHPDADIRLSGGRRTLGTRFHEALDGGINAAITGDLLTTLGATTAEDRQYFADHGYTLTP